jgi:hypothetical protein
MSDILFDRRSPFFLILGVVGWGRVYEIIGFKHKWLVKPAPTKLSITNDKGRPKNIYLGAGFTHNNCLKPIIS